MAQEEKLLKQDDLLLGKMLSDLPQFQAPGRKVVDAYDELKLDEFTNDTLEELKTKGVAGIQARYRKQVSDDIARMGIRNETLKESFASSTEAPLSDFTKAWADFQKFEPANYSSRIEFLSLEHISYRDGRFVVTEEDKENILESRCRIYLRPGEETELYDILNKFIEPYKEFTAMEKRLGLQLRPHATMAVLNNFFFELSTDQMGVNADVLRGAINYKGIRERVMSVK